MNRKGTLEQNDISIIIGNLPKRLQEKITQGNNVGSSAERRAKNVLQNKETNEGDARTFLAAKSTTAAPYEGPASREQNQKLGSTKQATSEDFVVLSAAAKARNVTKTSPVLEASGSAFSNTEDAVSNENEKVDLAIPGIIRLRVEDAKRMKNDCNKREEDLPNPSDRPSKHKQNHHHLHHQSKLHSFNDLPMSPVRQILKVSHPAWLSLMDDKINKEELLFLLEELQKLTSGQVVEVNCSIIDNKHIYY